MLKISNKIISTIAVATGGAVMFGAICTWKNDPTFYRHVLMPAVRKLDPETSHRLAILACKWVPTFLIKTKQTDDNILEIKLWNRTFTNPIGLAAGFDKHGEAVQALHALGFGFVEVGSITPLPQPGNPKPRVFRLELDRAVINRYGFNSDGHEVVKQRLEPISNLPVSDRGILAINLGQNKTTTEPWIDYAKGVTTFGPMADFLVVNISSPNTPGLRSLQKRQALEHLIDKVLEARNQTFSNVPVLIKIAPDLNDEELSDIAQIAIKKRVDGIVISNTTVTRPDSLKSSSKSEIGGLSGAPLKQISTDMIRRTYKLTKGCIPIVGVGGIQSGQDAYEKIRAGASLIELYSVLVYEGPPVVQQVKQELTALLKCDGFTNIADAVGVEHKNK
ncbi:hypothetical protein CHUAL_003974 [Chamberlinius hualienensis]